MDRVEKGFMERLKKTKAIGMLGTGMDAGELNDFSHEICLLLLLKVFRREIMENPNRSKQDLITIAQQIIGEMNIQGDRSNIERLVDGVLWYKDPNKQEPFKCQIYNEETRKHEEYKFKYLKVDREHTHWQKGGQTVYMLTEVAQEIIFLTREVLEEFGFDIEQFYTLQLIKTGNFNKAQSSVDNLIGRVRTLIRREKDYRDDIIRNPQVIFFDTKREKSKSEEDIKRQFEDEEKVFDDMFIWKDRVESFPNQKRIEAEEVFEKLERARILHNYLAKLVVENMAYEVEVRVKYPETFWKTSSISFRKDIWQNIIVREGLPKPDFFESILNPLFSPDIEFLFPLDWSWEEQSLKKNHDFDDEEKDFEDDDEWEPEVIDWDIILDLWENVFDVLLEEGVFPISRLQHVDRSTKAKWLSQKVNLDIFMMFVITDTELKINYESIDEPLELFRRLCVRNEKYKNIIGKIVLSREAINQEPLQWAEIYISPYEIYLS